MCPVDRPLAGFQDYIRGKSVFPEPAGHLLNFSLCRPPSLNAEGVQNRIIVPMIQIGILFGLGNGSD